MSSNDNNHDDEEPNLVALIAHWKAACVDEEDVRLRNYVMAWEQLRHFMNKMGVLFQLIDKDVCGKLRTIESSIAHGTVSRLVLNEVVHGRARRNNSCSLALIRLHRAMQFAMEVMRLVRDCNDKEPMGRRVREVYGRTLGAHLPWFINSPVHLAFCTFPRRKQLLINLAGPNPTQQASAMITQALEYAHVVYERIHAIFTKHQLHDMPQY